MKGKHINIVQQPASYCMDMLQRLGQTEWLAAATLHTPFAIEAFLAPTASLTAAQYAWMRLTAGALLARAMGQRQEAPYPPTLHCMPWRHKQHGERAFKPVEQDNIATELVLLLDPRAVADGVPRPATCVAAPRGLFAQTPFREYSHGAADNGLVHVRDDEREARATHRATHRATLPDDHHIALLLLTSHHHAHRCSP